MTEIIYERKAKEKAQSRFIVTEKQNGFFVWEANIQTPIFRFIGWSENSTLAIDYCRDVADGKIIPHASICGLEDPRG